MKRIPMPAGSRFLLAGHYDIARDGGSLTARLRRRHPELAVTLLGERLERGSAGRVLRRRVLIGDERLLVYAHSELPLASLRGRWMRLRKLGTRPLGEVLFSSPHVERRQVDFLSLHLPGVAGYRRLWARRSTFYLYGRAIVVSEVLF